MHEYFAIIKAFLDSSIFLKYHDSLDYKFIKENHPEIFRILQAVRFLHKDGNENTFSLLDLRLTFKSLYPQSSEAEYNPIWIQLEETHFETNSLVRFLNTIQSRKNATEIALKALAYAEGRAEQAELTEAIQQFSVSGSPTETSSVQDFVTDDLEQLYEQQVAKPGLRWPLESLNKALGSLRKGDFGFLFARPETGKTTFLAHAVSYMAGQCASPILWFNNEEQGEKVQLRCFQAALGVDLPTLYSQRARYAEQFKAQTKGNIKIVTDASITKQRVEKLCAQYNPSLIIFDQIDKLVGFAEDRDDLVLTAIYGWVRELAKKYCPAIGVCQAGASGDGKRWLTMNDVNNSKTGKQGEVDWILGIGCALDDGLETYRYLHLSKNKLSGDKDSDPTLRHGKWECRIQPDIARYADI